MPEVTLRWVNASKDNPGFSVYYATPERDPDVLYVIRYKRAKRGFTPVGWRVFVRSMKGSALQTIYFGEKLKECKQFVQDLEEQIVASQGQPADA